MSMPKGKDWADFMAEEWIEVMREIYRTKSTPKDMVHFPIVKYLGEQLTNAIDEVFGELDFDSPDHVMREALKNNVWDFSVAKNYNDNIAINNLLLKEDGSLRSWSDFKYEAEKIVGRSNRYLKTEYNTVVAGAQMSRLWQEIQRDKHLFPFVKFDVIMDGHTSEICSPLHNVIVSVDDPMLMYYFPPNHFNCRTTLRKLRRGVPTKNYQLPNIPDDWKNNPGMSGKIFTDGNRYIANTPMKLFAPIHFYEDNGVMVSYIAKKSSSSTFEMKRIEKEYQVRLMSARALSDYFKETVYVLPEINVKHWAYPIHFHNTPIKGKVPDLKVNQEFWEVESYERKFKIGKLSRMMKEGAEQSPKVVIKLNHFVDMEKIKKQFERLSHSVFEFPEEVIIVSDRDKVLWHYIKSNRKP